MDEKQTIESVSFKNSSGEEVAGICIKDGQAVLSGDIEQAKAIIKKALGLEEIRQLRHIGTFGPARQVP